MADAYEREHMPGVGAVLLRRKVTSPRWAIGLVMGLPLVLGLAFAAAAAVSGQIQSALGIAGGALAFSAVMALVMVTFATARVAVSEGELHVQLGFAGPRIPIGEITSVRVAPSGTNRMGMGVRKQLDGTTVYTLWGDNARAVHVERAGGSKLILVCKEPEAIARAIEEARARRDAPGRARIAADAEAEASLADEGAASDPDVERRASAKP